MSQHQHSHHNNNNNNNNRIGKYQIIKTLGEGSFGKVKLAYYEDNKVALKIISTNKLKADDMRGRIDREIQFLRLLRHPHIIKLYDVMKSPNEIIMVMEFAQNELFDYIVQRDKMSEQEARRFFQQIISAVEYCHRLKIVHRDLKPENLLLDDNLNVKIADFGLSNIMTDGNFLKTSCGSPNYASPEVISGKLYAGPEVDVWSCGVILYVMLCRRLPFDDESIPVLFKNISNGVYTLPKFLSPGAANLIKKMLIVNPLNRITVDEIFEDEWFKVDLQEYLLPKNTTATNYTTTISTTPINTTNTTSTSITSDNNNDNNNNNKRTKYDERFDHPIDYSDNLVAILSNTLNYDPEEVKEALTNTSAPAVKNPKYVEIRHAYLLIKDNQELIHDLESSEGTNKNGTNSNISSIGGSGNDFANGEGNVSTSSAGTSATNSRSNTATPNNSNVPSSFNNDVYPDETSTISILPSSLPSIHRANMMAKGGSRAAHKITPLNRTPNITTRAIESVHAGNSNLADGNHTDNPMGTAAAQQYNPTNYASLAPPTKMKKTKWHFGIRSRSYPLDVMGEIYIALKNLGAEWCRPSEEELWTIRVRWKYESNNNNSNSNSNTPTTTNTTNNNNNNNNTQKAHSPDYMRMVIQLFQIEPNNYLVDFKFNGWEDEAGVLVHSSQEEAMNTFSAYPFLHLTTRLIMELAVNSG